MFSGVLKPLASFSCTVKSQQKDVRRSGKGMVRPKFLFYSSSRFVHVLLPDLRRSMLKLSSGTDWNLKKTQIQSFFLSENVVKDENSGGTVSRSDS